MSERSQQDEARRRAAAGHSTLARRAAFAPPGLAPPGRAWRRIPRWIARRGILFIDGILVGHYRVEIFTDNPECILRTSLRTLDVPVDLPDGSTLRAGDKLIELHFWNEHLPWISDEGADVLWGTRFVGQLVYSLRLLAKYAISEPRYEGFAAIHGRLGFISREDIRAMKVLARRFGFMLELQVAPGLRFWRAAYWASLYTWWLMWTFNPNTLRTKRFREMTLSDLWMTRDTLLERYGEAPTPAEATSGTEPSPAEAAPGTGRSPAAKE